MKNKMRRQFQLEKILMQMMIDVNYIHNTQYGIDLLKLCEKRMITVVGNYITFYAVGYVLRMHMVFVA